MTPMLATIHRLREQEFLSDLDIQFAEFIAKLADNPNDNVLLGALLASYFTTQGHICVDLTSHAGQSFPATDAVDTLKCPELSQWTLSLQESSVVGRPGDYAPLILDQQRLYLYRYWEYEQILANAIRTRLQTPRHDIDLPLLQTGLARLFPSNINLPQQQAVQTSVLHHFCVISGGPGTGKTFLITKILALLLEQQPHLHIALAAPTGKAAARLQATVTTTKQHLPCTPAIQSLIPEHTYTIHRLLGSLPNSPYFRHDAKNPLIDDVVIVDEASMVDLALIAKLAQAIKPSARWILLGDKDQLASVEAGTVLGDLSASTGAIRENIILLEDNYRFPKSSGIGQLAHAVTQGQSAEAWQLLQAPEYPDISWQTVGESPTALPHLRERIMSGFSEYLRESDPATALAAFDHFRLLCAVRHGYFGVVAMNRWVEQILSAAGLLRSRPYHWYAGRPIMITRNDYTLKLFNGDVGIIWRDPENSQELLAFFPAANDMVRSFVPSRLPEHETVYAMTIHKSQGSEFNEVLLLLPSVASPLLTRELIYTGITRARHRVEIYGQETLFKMALAQSIQRISGLQALLS